MVKKTKLKKGGRTFLEKLTGKYYEGTALADNINENIKNKKASALLEEYKLRKNIAEDDFKIATAKFKQEEDTLQLEADRRFKYDKLKLQNFNILSKIAIALVGYIGNLIKYITSIFFKIFDYVPIFINTIRYIIEIIPKYLDIGKGAVVKLLLLLLLLALIIYALVSMFQKKPSSTINNNMSSKTFSIFPENGSFNNLLGSFIKDAIPSTYRVELNSIINRVNLAVGNDIKANAIDTKNRETITDGRYNGITHIKQSKDDNNTYITSKPNDFELVLNIDDYTDKDIDFNKLPQQIKEKIKANFRADSILKFTSDIKNNKYRYRISPNNYIYMNDDIINQFDIKNIESEPIRINKKDRNKYMFEFTNKFQYPNIAGNG
jgi:hypothetical protein